ncbi:MAG: oligosaccharide flippase family protein [Desulfobacterales bacterium]|nr:oligosaccharide flippase family protein [Desulfobacterales bacterium]
MIGFAATPYIVGRLGAERYGFLSMIAVVVGYFAFLNLGLGPAMIKYISEYHARNDSQKIHRLLATGMVFFTTVGLLGSLGLILLSDAIVTRLFHIPACLLAESKTALRIAAVGFMLNMPLSVLSSVPRALQRFDISNKLDLLFGTVTILATLVLLYVGAGLVQLAALNLAVGLISVAVYAPVCRKLLPGISFKPAFDGGIFRELLKYGGSILVTQVMGRIIFQIDKIIIGLFLPIAQLTFYVIPFNLSQKILIIPGIISPVIFPAISELHALNEKKKFKKLYFSSTKLIVAATLPLTIILTVFANQILNFWLGPGFAEKGTLSLQMLSAVFFLTTLTIPVAVFAQGMGRPDMPMKFSTIHAVINILLWLSLIPKLGINGAALGLFVSHIIIVPWAIVYFHKRIIKSPVKELFFSSYKPCFLIGAVFFAVAYFAVNIIYNLLGLVIFTAAYCALYYTAMFFMIMNEEERGILLKYIRK